MMSKRDEARKILICFSGKRGVGKTLAAEYLVREYGFEKRSFAARLKELSQQLFPFSPKHFTPENKEVPYNKYEWTPREFMIKFGDFMRYWEPAYWIHNVDLEGNMLALDDLRFKNEAKHLKDRGAVLVRIHRYAKQIKYKHTIDDPSETDLDDYEDFDFHIWEVDNATRGSLYKTIDRIMGELGIDRQAQMD